MSTLELSGGGGFNFTIFDPQKLHFSDDIYNSYCIQGVCGVSSSEQNFRSFIRLILTIALVLVLFFLVFVVTLILVLFCVLFCVIFLVLVFILKLIFLRITIILIIPRQEQCSSCSVGLARPPSRLPQPAPGSILSTV